jgi:uncharacterized membrane protein
MWEQVGIAVLFAATLTSGLMGGLFYAFACSVMPGLRATDDRTFVHTMQRINVAILNVWFALAFGGTVVLTVLALLFNLGREGRSALPGLVAGLVLYVATLAITFVLNIPLNNALDRAGDPDRIDDLGAVRRAFEAPWVRWNLVRTATNTAAFGCLIWACLAR